MTLKYLLDTNVISEALRPTPDAQVLARLRKHQSAIATAAVVWHELCYGCYRLPVSARRSVIEAYLRDVVERTMPILPYDQRAAAWHGVERARLVQDGHTPPFADGQIAAIAATNDLTLVTFNPADYAGFRDVQLEDWRK